jgi:cytochrome c oxidase accessory protein FixG
MKLPGSALYAPHKRIFVKHIWGQYQAKRWAIFAFLYAGFFALPWLRIGDRPAVLLDIPERRFHILWVTFWPQDTYLLALFLIACALALFMVTAVFGRAWCGYVCPQTVGTSVFLEIERRIEGDRPAQLRLAQAPWTADKIKKRVLKHALFILISVLFSFNLVAYFVGMYELVHRTLTLTLTATNIGWLIAFFLLAYNDFGHFREQMCHGPCPYGRFQGVMLDPNSLVVSFDVNRGEPRQFFRKGQERHAGDCVNCNLCVDVCPAGIDIRQGPQFECISCMRCADACNGVMDKVGFKQGLIRVASENELAGRPTRTFRPRLAVYGLILTGLVTTLGVQIAHHETTAVDVVRNRSFVYRQLADGRVANVYLVKAINMDEHPHTYRLAIKGLPARPLTSVPPIEVPAEQVVQQSVALAVKPNEVASGVARFQFVLKDEGTGRVLAEHPSTFVMPTMSQSVVSATSGKGQP